MITGYGVDFTPARVRVAEIRDAVEQYHAKLNEDLAAKRDIARTSRAIEDLCVAFPEEAAAVRIQMHEALTGQSGLIERAKGLRALHAQTVEMLSIADVQPDMSTEGDIYVTPYINTTRESNCRSKNKWTRSNEQDTNQITGSKAASLAFEQKPGGLLAQRQVRTEAERDPNPEAIQAEVLGSVSIGLLHSACREAQSFTGVQLDSWSALAQSGAIFRRMIGLSEAGWLDGHTKVGLYAASAIVATVLEKHIRDPAQISKPGGYFRAMVERAIDGQLNLERSLFGLADSKYGN